MTQASQTPTVPLPRGIEILYENDSFIIRRRWLSRKVIFLTFFTLIWNGSSAALMAQAIATKEWEGVAFGSFFVFVGLWFLYFTTASYINKTDITVNPDDLTVRHFPMPWFGNRKIPVQEITQLHTTRHVQHNKNNTVITFRVHVATRNKRKKKLLSGLHEQTQATFIEKEIESILGITNRKVSGALR